jgi:hypothetical protein
MAYRFRHRVVVYRGVEAHVQISEDEECLGPGVAIVTDRAGEIVTSIYPSVSVDAHDWLVAALVKDWIDRNPGAQAQLGLSPLSMVP